ncbi:GNAT family N-acetyltransferase [Arthrobacter sp. ISL-28]|uniref:GNAT family N-acetyltransferase n=1 Tax=Arthrobacter sp. ISL-28 TaxID=2819108 RepID=UPI001BE6EBC7|nr:GNAT family N-acetyltransferase [Arthrobacter sp. ISL-28]MBT2520319.1 acetyltransferase [Arthrobacter sp. ISL-28]
MTALTWSRDLVLEGLVLRLAAPADAEGLAALMAEPDVEQWWHQAWEPERWAECISGFLEDPDSLALALTEGDRVTGYVEVYRVATDVLGRHISHTRTDLGMHLALAEGVRGRGLGARLISGVRERAQQILDGCGRLVAEPDLRNQRSHRAFAEAGFQAIGAVQLPDKTAWLMAAEPGLFQPHPARHGFAGAFGRKGAQP